MSIKGTGGPYYRRRKEETMKYKTIDELDARIERIVKKKVISYYSDWKKYDRLKYMCLKGSNDRKDKTAILIARKYGTYLLTLEDIATRPFAATVYEYYQTQEQGDYYIIDIDRLTINRIDPETLKIKKAA